mgnify:CR=1 FL=1
MGGLHGLSLLIGAVFIVLIVYFQFKPRLEGYAIKVPVFSFDKFPNVDKSLGPEMKSTGEAIYFIKDLKDPFFRQVYGERSMYLSR